MNRRRVVFVTRRFWPLVGEAENALAELVVALSNDGFPITVLTPRWRSDWPQSFLFDKVHVVRLAKPAKTWWGTRGFSRECAKWLEQAKADVALLVATDGPDTEPISAAARRLRKPVVLLANDVETPDHRRGRLLRSSNPMSDAVVVTHRSASDAWVDAGYSASSIRMIPPGVAIPSSPRSEELRRSARQAFAKAMPDSQLGPHTPLAICFHALDEAPTLPRLFNVWRQLVDRLPDAQLWILGAGPQRGDLNALVESLHLQGRIVLPGVLEYCDELLACADLYIAPEGAGEGSISLLQAMAAGLPIVAADTSIHRRYITNNQHGLHFAKDGNATCLAAIESVLAQPVLAAALGANAQTRVATEFALPQRVSRFASLFEELMVDARGS